MKMTINKYVITATKILRVQLVSQALSISTRTLRCWILLISRCIPLRFSFIAKIVYHKKRNLTLLLLDNRISLHFDVPACADGQAGVAEPACRQAGW